MNFNKVLEMLTEGSKPKNGDPERRKNNTRDGFKKPGKHQIGDRVVGVRSGSASNELEGELVKQDVTVNDGYRNPCYHVKCDKDGKIRKYQFIQKAEKE